MNQQVLSELCYHFPSCLEDLKERVFLAHKLVKNLNKETAVDLYKLDKLCKFCIDINISWINLENQWKQFKLDPEYWEAIDFQSETHEECLVRQIYIFAKENTIWKNDSMTVEGSTYLLEYYLNDLWKILIKAVNQAKIGLPTILEEELTSKEESAIDLEILHQNSKEGDELMDSLVEIQSESDCWVCEK